MSQSYLEYLINNTFCHYFSCFYEVAALFFHSYKASEMLFCFVWMPWHFLLITISFLLLFQLILSTYSREGCHKGSALDLIFLFPFLSQDFSVVTSDFDVTHGWIMSIVPSCQLYVLVVLSPICWNALSLLPFGYIVTS